MMFLSDEAIACLALFGGVAILVFVGLSLLAKMWRQYRQSYIEGASVTLDAMYVTLPPHYIFYLGIVSAVIVGAIVFLLAESALLAILFAIPAAFLPLVFLRYLKKKRDALFGLQLIDALANISNSLRAGFSLPQALELVYREMPNPMSQEIRLVCQELRLGVPMEEALAHLYQRMPLPDVDLVVTAIGIVRDVGGNLTEIFDNIAATIRERHRIEGKIAALTAQGRMQAIVVCLLPFLVAGGLAAVAPGMFRPMVTTPLGWAIFAVILVLEMIGVLFIRKIVTIEV